jgi:hypothetical protein
VEALQSRLETSLVLRGLIEAISVNNFGKSPSLRPQDLDDAIEALRRLSREIALQKPDPNVLKSGHKILHRLYSNLSGVGRWIGQKADRFVDGTVDSVSKLAIPVAVIAYLVAHPEVEKEIAEIIHALDTVLKVLPH